MSDLVPVRWEGMTLTAIKTFDGEFRFLSNFYPCVVWHDGIRYPSVEHAFQAAKTLDFSERWRISQLGSPGEAKRAGKQVRLRPDWDKIKRQVMQEILLQKFILNAELREKLKATKEAQLIEGNTWGDTYWGVCMGEGQNHLGQLLMAIRRIL